MSILLIVFIITILLIAIAITVVYKYYTTESFIGNSGSDNEKIIQTYNEILQRDPTVSELKSIKKSMKKKNLNFYKLRVLLYSSDEYYRIIKIQTNTTTPELMIMIAQQKYVEKINKIYKDTFNKKINSDLVLPYQDLYDYKFKLKDDKLKEMLQDERYNDFEEEVLATNGLDRDMLFDIYHDKYEKKHDKNKKKSKVIPAYPPQPYYILTGSSIANDASSWEESDSKASSKIIPPWKNSNQPELTYHKNIDRDKQEKYEENIGMKTFIFPSTSRPKPVDVNKPLPLPKYPLQSTLIGSKLSTTPLTKPKPKTNIKEQIKPTMYLSSPITLSSIILPKVATNRQVSDLLEPNPICK